MRILLFDAANTLIHKPTLWDRIQEVLTAHDYEVDRQELKKRHKLLSEVINFPDRTSKDFYRDFNTELLLSLGILPTEELLEDLFSNCTYQPWQAFDDCQYLFELNIRKAILSNFNSSLSDLIGALIGQDVFDEIIISETEKVRKPSLEFYQIAIDRLDVDPSEVLYIGDSLKLDFIPAKTLGMNTLLIDRDGIYRYPAHKISSFKELKNHI
ncbi:HAD-IA family hydrolase [Sphingobacterium sp. SGG-5]|uniref:HAD family hydrolase n=1 Tax=Sphingobacterium sp. SGG-5 TaxID=2710881 RepID=UPI0013EA3E5E|nr:HAD family hydrolase [Sphingobacterium sp. SGG-5]NGM63430.1 HAD-IA family hydrolase [Sphingobacterium sp. SGG-5]